MSHSPTLKKGCRAPPKSWRDRYGGLAQRCTPSIFKLREATHWWFIKSIYCTARHFKENEIGNDRKCLSRGNFVRVSLPVGCCEKAGSAAVPGQCTPPGRPVQCPPLPPKPGKTVSCCFWIFLKIHMRCVPILKCSAVVCRKQAVLWPIVGLLGEKVTAKLHDPHLTATEQLLSQLKTPAVEGRKLIILKGISENTFGPKNQLSNIFLNFHGSLSPCSKTIDNILLWTKFSFSSFSTVVEVAQHMSSSFFAQVIKDGWLPLSALPSRLGIQTPPQLGPHIPGGAMSVGR